MWATKVGPLDLAHDGPPSVRTAVGSARSVLGNPTNAEVDRRTACHRSNLWLPSLPPRPYIVVGPANSTTALALMAAASFPARKTRCPPREKPSWPTLPFAVAA